MTAPMTYNPYLLSFIFNFDSQTTNKMKDCSALISLKKAFSFSFHKKITRNYKKGALDSQPQVIKFTSCLPMVGGSLRVLRLLPTLKLVAMIHLKYCWKWR